MEMRGLVNLLQKVHVGQLVGLKLVWVNEHTLLFAVFTKAPDLSKGNVKLRAVLARFPKRRKIIRILR